MASYRVVVDISNVPLNQRRTAARRLKSLIEKHEPFNRRTGNLSRSSYIELYNDLNLLVCGAKAHYASYLHEGTVHIVGKPYIKRAVNRILPNASIVREGPLGI